MTGPGSTADNDQSRGVDRSHSGWCGTTDWSALILAGRDGCPGAAEALDDLCRRYWPPVYAYVRRCGHAAAQAEDLTQGFFAHLLGNNVLANLDGSKGRFRSFLMVAFKNFLANEWDRERAKKRGGGRPLVSLDEFPAEENCCAIESPVLGPDELYDKRWALAVLGQALARLKADEEKAGRGVAFARLQVYLTVDGADDSYHAPSEELGSTPAAVAMAVCRLRRRFREALRAEIATTVTMPSQVDEELRCLSEALRQK